MNALISLIINLYLTTVVISTGIQIFKNYISDKKIQKDFFSAGEYLIYGTQQHIELPYYANKKKNHQKVVLKVTKSISSKGGSGRDLQSRRRKR